MTTKTIYLIPFIISSAGVFSAPPAAADDPHHPFGEDLYRQCADELNAGTLPVDAYFPNGGASQTLGSFASEDHTECWNFGWAEYTGNNTWFTVTPEFGGPNISTSEWDCNHSSYQFSIYGQTEFGFWVYLRGGLGYGQLVNGTCTHSVSNFPEQAWGRDSWTQFGGTATFRVAVQSWSHDDHDFGHPSDLCADPINCTWNTILTITEE